MNTLLQVEGLEKHYPAHGGLFTRRRRLTAVAGVSFSVAEGETFGLVGESGSGKSTIARLIMGAERPSAGEIRLDGHRFGTAAEAKADAWRRRFLQPVLQDPQAALNPRLSIGAAIAEPLQVQRPEAATEARVATLLEQVGLPAEFAKRRPRSLSGGQRQRVVIARALALDPRLVILDEPVSALDVSIQAQVLNLLLDLQARHSLTYLLISHDLAVIAQMSSRIGVLYLGRLVEIGPRRAIIASPAHPYTRALLAAAGGDTAAAVAGEMPSPLDPPAGCAFHTRCPIAAPRCRAERPALRTLAPDHAVACHLA